MISAMDSRLHGNDSFIALSFPRKWESQLMISAMDSRLHGNDTFLTTVIPTKVGI